MERNFFDDELEDFLKRKANQYKIYPSDKVWSGIYTALHTGRKWHILGGALLLIGILTLISLEKDVPDYKKKNNIATSSAVTSYLNNTIENAGSGVIHTAFKSVKGKKLLKLKTETTNQTIEDSRFKEISISNSLIQTHELSLIRRTMETGTTVRNSIAIKEIVKENNAINWLEEKVLIKLSPSQRKRLNVQFYLAPTISYRRWQSGNLSNANQSSMITSRGIKGLADQTPALGLELGSALQLNITKNLMLKTGLQLNYVRYNISAYRSSPEKKSITLSSAGSYSPPTTITTYSTLRNFNGGYPETIQNQYVQLSIPIGAEWKVTGNKRLQLNVAGSVQPTYMLMNSAYMLTSDFSNYTKESSLVRKWNVNASVETFISYYRGGVRWQIGPQFRYQLLSSYTNRYPIHEYLMEYGMKIGVSKTIR